MTEPCGFSGTAAEHSAMGCCQPVQHRYWEDGRWVYPEGADVETDPEQPWADALLRATASIFPGLPSLARAAIRERDAAEAVIRKVARLHVPVREGQNEGVCSQCRVAEPWPCETVRALPIWARTLGPRRVADDYTNEEDE